MNRVYFHQKSDNFNNTDNLVLELFQSDSSYNTVSFYKQQINNFLPWKFNENTIDIIYVPVFLESNNYLNYTGVEFALHWYFYLSQQNRAFSIVLLGVETQLAFFKHCKYGNFLKSPNVHYIDYNYSVIKNAETKIIPKLCTSEEYIKAIKEIQIKRPSSYRTHHSIANEWAIYRWANAIDANDSDIENIISNVKQQLYFAYLRTIYPVSQINKLSERQLKIESKTKPKVLYIDDEADKGWYKILYKILNDINSFEFDYLGNELKMKTKDEIIEFSISKVANMGADIVILDFRLHESDFDNKLDDVTGLKILLKIKELNPGIQVIIFSATNKIWNLLELQKAGADGFILKESPEKSIDGNFTQNSLEKLITELSVCLKMCPLKSIYERISKVRSNVTFNSELEKLISQKLETGFLLINQSRIENQDYYINHAYLELFQVIEAFLYEVFEEDQNAYVKLNDGKTICVQQVFSNKISKAITFTRNNKYEMYKNESEIKNNRIPRLDTNFKVSSVLIFKYGNTNSSERKWTDIYTLRNGKAAHFDKEKIEDLITFDEIIQLCDFLIYFTDIKNENGANFNKGLKEKSLNEIIDLAVITNPNFKKDDRINKK
ncbi:MAG: response regulator [Paludibacteraceae bacterium]